MNEQKIKKCILFFQKKAFSIKMFLNFGYWCNSTESFVLALEILYLLHNFWIGTEQAIRELRCKNDYSI